MLVPCFKRSNPAVRGLVDPSAYDESVWTLGKPAPEPLQSTNDAPVDEETQESVSTPTDSPEPPRFADEAFAKSVALFAEPWPAPAPPEPKKQKGRR